MEKNGSQIYEEFTSQLSGWTKNGEPPKAGNIDIRHGLALQKKRLEKFRIRMDCELELRDGPQELTSSADFCDKKYSNQLVSRAYKRTVDFYKDNKKCLSRKDNEILYTIITRLNESEIQETYCCPNCGAISAVKELLEGCPYCHTQFLMSDLFPKVTNYYFLPDYGLGENESKRRIKKWMIGGALIAMAFALPDRIMDIVHGGLVIPMILLLVSGVMGSVFGYFALAISLLFRVLKGGVKQTPMMIGLLGAKKRLTQFMKQYESGFSFEYFLGKVQALLKIMIFTDDRSNLAVYEGKPGDHGLDNIIEAQFGGAVKLNDCQLEGDYCYLDLDVYMEDVYYKDSRVRHKSERIQIGLGKNIRRPVDYGFSIKKVTCHHCGASFDASMERRCPYCKSDYDLKEDDWVITFIRKR